MENQIKNTDNEMFLISKYKYLNRLAKTAVKISGNNLANKINVDIVGKQLKKGLTEEEKTLKKAEEELKNKLKEEKKKKMAEMCKPGAKSENKTKFVEKEKYVDDTPKGQKKGKFYIKVK
jgi:putative N-acetylmannosamine-6-phosphate epimerase